MKFLNQQPLESFENDRSIFIDTVSKTLGVGGKLALFKNNDVASFRTNIKASNSLAADYTLTLPSTDGTIGQILSTDGAGNLSFIDGTGTGTVTSVNGTGTVSGISLSGTVSVSGDLTLSGTLEVIPNNFDVQAANTILAGPATGSSAKPTFRTLVAADLPILNQNTTGEAGSVAAGNLTGNTLASGVTSSSLTSVGTITSGTWNGSIIVGTYGGTGINNGSKTITLGGNLTTSGAFNTTIAVSASTSVTLPTSGTLVGSNDSGTVTNTMLAGSIANNKLSNSTISGISLGSNLNTLTIGSGLNGTSYNGSSAVTIAIDSTVALKADTHYIGTTSVALNRSSANLALTGITSITGGSSASQSLVLQSTSGVGTSDSILFKVGNNGSTTAMTINTSGNVGIGTSSPTFPLSINSSNPKILINDTAGSVERGSLLFHDSGSAIWEIQNRDIGLVFFNRQSGYRTDLYIERATGNIGIGTSSPSNSLHIKATSNPVIRLEGTSDSGYVDYNGTRLSLHAGAGSMYFITGSSEKMRIDTSGNVGIGTTSPGYKLDASGSGDISRITSSTTSSGLLIADSTGTIRIGSRSGAAIFDTGSSERMRISSAGDVQIGTNVDAGNALRYLDVQNSNTGAASGAILRLITSNYAGSGTTSVDIVKYKTGGLLINNNETNAAAYTAFNVGASERMRIDSSGNVTISGTLIVNGTTTTLNSNTLTIDDKNIEIGSVTAVTPTGNISASSAIVTNLSSTVNIIPGSAITTLSGNGTVTLPANTTVASVDSATQITLSQNLTGTGSATAATLTITGATDVTANGGGITLKGATDKTLNWVSSTNAWTSSENFNLASGMNYLLNGTNILASTTYIGTTSIALNRLSASQTLSGVNIDGSAGKATNIVGGNSTTLLGSIPYQSNTDTTTLLGPNTTTTKKFLRMTGTGTNGAAPAWDTIVAGDIPTLNQNTTGSAGSVSNSLTISSPLSGTSFNGSSAVTIALAASYGDTQNPYASKTANYFLAAPNGSAGAPTFRAIVAADIPTLNQNTTGSAATLTTSRNINGVAFNGSADITVTAAAGTLSGSSLASGVTASSLTSVGTLTGLTVSGASNLATTSGSVGIGTASPSYPLHVITANEWGIALRLSVNTASNRATILTQKSLGTTASPTTVTNGTILGGISSGGYDGTSWGAVGYNGGTEILSYAAETWSSTARGSYLTFNTTATGTISAPERMRIDSNGNVGIGTTAPANSLQVVGSIRSGAGPTDATNASLAMYNDGTGASIEAFQGNNATVKRNLWLNAYGGNVGVGTSSPGVLFDVNGTSRSSYNIVYGNATYVGQTITNMYSSGQGVSYIDAHNRNDVSDSHIFFVHNTDGSSNIIFGTQTAGTFADRRAQAAIIDGSGNFTATGNVTAYSDIKLKTNIETIDNALDKVSKMRGVMFTRKDTGEKSTGVIAQEMQEVLPEVVQEGEILSVAYGNIVGVLIEAIKELKAEIEQLKGSN